MKEHQVKQLLLMMAKIIQNRVLKFLLLTLFNTLRKKWFYFVLGFVKPSKENAQKKVVTWKNLSYWGISKCFSSFVKAGDISVIIRPRVKKIKTPS